MFRQFNEKGAMRFVVFMWRRKEVQEDIESGLLTELLADWEVPNHKIYAMYPSVSSLSRNAKLWLNIAENYYKNH